MCTLHQDGRSKFHCHFQSFQITTADGKKLSAGLSEVARGIADTLFTEFQELISELADAIEPSKSAGHEKDGASLVTSIIATMSDQDLLTKSLKEIVTCNMLGKLVVLCKNDLANTIAE